MLSDLTLADSSLLSEPAACSRLWQCLSDSSVGECVVQRGHGARLARTWNHSVSVDGKTARPLPGSGTTNISWGDQPNGSAWKAEVDQRTPDGWRIRSVWVEQRGVPVLRELHVTPHPPRQVPARGLTAKALRLLRHEAKLALLRERAAEHFADSPAALADLKALIHGDRKKLGGRRGHTDAFYAGLAIAYEEVAAAGLPIRKTLAAKYSVSESRIGSLIHDCRSRGFLDAAVGGRAGGRATAKARRRA